MSRFYRGFLPAGPRVHRPRVGHRRAAVLRHCRHRAGGRGVGGRRVPPPPSAPPHRRLPPPPRVCGGGGGGRRRRLRLARRGRLHGVSRGRLRRRRRRRRRGGGAAAAVPPAVSRRRRGGRHGGPFSGIPRRRLLAAADVGAPRPLLPHGPRAGVAHSAVDFLRDECSESNCDHDVAWRPNI